MMRAEEPEIIFDKSSKDFILDMFDKKIDNEGFIVEKANEKQRVLTFELEELKAEKFGGIQKGPEIFIEDNFVSLFKLIDKE